MHFPLFYLHGIGGGVQCRAIQHGGCTAPVAGRKGTDAGDHKETEGWDGGGQTVAGERGEASGMSEEPFSVTYTVELSTQYIYHIFYVTTFLLVCLIHVL